MKEKFTNRPTILGLVTPATIMGFLSGLLLIGFGWMLSQKQVFNDPQRTKFTAAISQRRVALNSSGYTDQEKSTMEANAMLGFQNCLIAYEEAQELQKKNWLYWLRILPGPDDVCAARAKFQIGNCMTMNKQLDQAEEAFAAFPLMFPGGYDPNVDLLTWVNMFWGDPISEIWNQDINNLEVVRHSQQKQEQQDGKGKDGKDGKDKKKKKQGSGNQQQDDQKPEKDDQQAGKGSVKKI